MYNDNNKTDTLCSAPPSTDIVRMGGGGGAGPLCEGDLTRERGDLMGELGVPSSFFFCRKLLMRDGKLPPAVCFGGLLNSWSPG